MRREAFYLEAADGWRFALHTPAQQQPTRAALLHLHGFAEELNKTRRPVAQAVARFAAAGFACLQLDLHGCGDSSGDFADASWAAWQQDAQGGLAWLRQRYPGLPVVAWGLRAGALLASELPAQGQLWWQPVLQGSTQLQQFLRLRLAADMAQAGPKQSVAQLKAQLASQGELEIGGYRLPQALAEGLALAQLQAPRAACLWLEASSQDEPALLPASQALLARWQTSHAALPAPEQFQALALADPAPWAALELEDLPALTARSEQWLLEQFA